MRSVMPGQRKAPTLWPTEPVSVTSIVPSASPAAPWRARTSPASKVPTVRWTLRTGSAIFTGCFRSIAGAASRISSWSKWLATACSWARTQRRGKSPPSKSPRPQRWR